jgi:hypothetical protein
MHPLTHTRVRFKVDDVVAPDPLDILSQLVEGDVQGDVLSETPDGHVLVRVPGWDFLLEVPRAKVHPEAPALQGPHRPW